MRRVKVGFGLCGLAALSTWGSVQAAEPEVTHAARPDWQGSLLLQRDGWQEQDAQGRTLLRERGPLHGLRLGWGGRVQGADVEAQGQFLGGERHYLGLGSQGATLMTRSEVRDVNLRLGVQWPLANAWYAAVAVAPRQVQRTLRSTATAQGYRETWRWTLAEAGLRWQPDRRSGWALEAAAGWGLSPSVRFTLPGMDPLTLHPGQGRSARAVALYRGALGGGGHPGWRWMAGLEATRLSFPASAAEPLTSNGLLRGGAAQPKTTLQSFQWRLGVEADLP